jgi:hypothetical protein
VRGVTQLEELWEAVRVVGKEGQGVERVYVLGLGSLVGSGAGSSILQLAVVEEVLVLLSAAAASSAATTATAAATVETAAAAAAPPPKIQTIFRDPAFTRTDHAFLLQRQYITESPDLPLAPTDSSILIAPHLEFSVVRDVLKTGWNPVLLLANDLKRFLDLFVPPSPPFPDGKGFGLIGGNRRVGDVNEWSVFLRFFEEERGGYKHKRLEVGGKENEAVQRAFSDLAVFWRVPPAAVVEEEQ